MKELLYNRDFAVTYAKKYALTRNPIFYNFDNVGGNCTNYTSQCLYAGLSVMNYKPNGWYYKSVADRSPAWSDVRLFHDFLITNEGVGPYGKVVDLQQAEIGDFIQLKNHTKWYHSLIITEILTDDVLICSNSADSLMRPLSSYYFLDFRCIKILGGRK